MSDLAADLALGAKLVYDFIFGLRWPQNLKLLKKNIQKTILNVWPQMTSEVKKLFSDWPQMASDSL